jgi:hypothetical protein
MHKFIFLDSEVIGVYQDDELQQIYFLTEKLSFYAYNAKSWTLERKADYKYAINVLQIKETIDYLLHNVDTFRMKSKHD